MRGVPVLITDPSGEVTAANEPAAELLGRCRATRCDEVVRASDPRGDGVCAPGCGASFDPGEQRDHGVVKVRGRGYRLVCTAVGEQRVVTMVPATAPSAEPLLTPREKEVLELVARGLTSHRIGRRLGMATSTVRTHAEHIRGKLGVRSRPEAVARALALGEIA